jgi:hypothetical protein
MKFQILRTGFKWFIVQQISNLNKKKWETVFLNAMLEKKAFILNEFKITEKIKVHR